jgi:molybdopterin-guanine dinucleotide biosynthesis protein A
VETNRVHALVEPDLSIFVGATGRPAKASARQARDHADVVLDGRLSADEIASVAWRRLRRGDRFSADEAGRLVEAIRAFYRSYLRRTDACALTAVILAGGRATRLGGRDKASIPVGGKTLLDRRVDLLHPLCPEVVIVSNRLAARASGGAPLGRDIRIVGDEAPGYGPLMGLYTGLLHSRTERSLVTACDMPFLSRPLLIQLRSYADTCDAVVPRMGRYLEPLFAVYSRSCLHAARSALDRGSRRADSFLDLVRTRYVDEPELRRYDPELISFFNVNTPEDLQRAERLSILEGA